MSTPNPLNLQKVSAAARYCAGWQSYDNRQMYFGLYEGIFEFKLSATDIESDAAGFKSVEHALETLEAAGFNPKASPWLEVKLFKGQWALF